MRRIKMHYAAHLFLRLLVIIGLIGVPSASWGQESAPLVDRLDVDNKLLADGELVFGPNVYDFNLYNYLEKNIPGLLPFHDALLDHALRVSISPRVLLTLLEMEYQVTEIDITQGIGTKILIWEDENSFVNYLKGTTSILLEVFYDRLIPQRVQRHLGEMTHQLHWLMVQDL